MRNFDVFAETPEKLGTFLGSLVVVNSPWEKEFNKAFCADCGKKDCTVCPHEKERENPLWWLKQEADQETATKAYSEENDGVCVGYGAYLGGWNRSGENYMEGVEKIILPKMSAYNQIIPERAELIMIFRSMEYADAVIKALGEICTLEIRVAIQHFNRIERCWDIHGNAYILEATPMVVAAEPLTMFGGTGVEVRFRVSRFSATDGNNERWRIEWTGKGAKAVQEKREAD